MSVPVVDILKVININQDHANRIQSSTSPRTFGAQMRIQSGTIRKVSDMVMLSLLQCLFDGSPADENIVFGRDRDKAIVLKDRSSVD